jgi:geranylgeranyl diphosphate synthase, type II
VSRVQGEGPVPLAGESSTQTGENFDLEGYLARSRGRVEKGLERSLEDLLPLIDPGQRGAVRQGIITGGKRLRPVLCMAAYEVCGGEDQEAIVDLAVALELLHGYSLMHDDLPCMDDAPLRRGVPTPHMVHGEVVTLIGGAALIPAAHLQGWRAAGRLGLPDAEARAILQAIAQAVGGEGMVGGQALDLLGEGRRLSRAELDQLHRRKTGALLEVSLSVGARAALAPAKERKSLEGYGRAIGLAFQIADDVLDATSDQEVLGKAPSDASLGKSTYVALLGVDGARDEANRLVRTAHEALARAELRSPPLEALASYVVERDR